MATKAELYERAGELGIASRNGMNKSQLASAIAEAESRGNLIDAPTGEHKVSAAGKESEELIADMASDDKKVAKAAECEIEKRSEKAKSEQLADSRKRKLPQQYVVTKRCLISSNGSLTDLAEGSIISAVTHSLNQIKQAGGEFEPCKGSKLVSDQFGRLHTVPIK